jgi:LAGLIDADG endonuclease
LPLVEKPAFVPSTSALDPHWIAGFVNGDGSFSLGFSENSKMRLGATCQPRFVVTQHQRDRILLERIQSSLACGVLYEKGSGIAAFDLKVTGLSTITDKVVPFFKSHSLFGAKALDFADFCRGIEIMNSSGHLTDAGQAQLRSLYFSMNSNRTKF